MSGMSSLHDGEELQRQADASAAEMLDYVRRIAKKRIEAMIDGCKVSKNYERATGMELALGVILDLK